MTVAIGWTTDTAADTFFTKRIGLISFWAGLSTAEKTAALTTAYDQLRFSKELSIPSSPTAAQLLVLAYAQHEFSAILAVLDMGGVRREAIQGQGVIAAGIVKESYDLEKSGKLPPRILDILDDYRTEKHFYQYNIYRKETDNTAFDNAFPTNPQND